MVIVNQTRPENVTWWKPVYADPVVTSSSTGAPAVVADPPAADPPPAGDPPSKDDGSFTPEQQKRIDNIVEKRVSGMKKEQQKTLEQLTQIKKTKDLTAGERDKLQERIDSLEASVMTKEELAAKNKKESDRQHQTELEQVTADRNSWKSRFEVSTIERSILDAASNTADDNPAINPRQIVTELRDKTKLVENTEDGVGTGMFVPRVKFEGQDSEGKPMLMDLTVPEAVTEMKKMDAEYGNLWNSGLTGGVGSNNTPGTENVLSDASLSSQEAYDKNRQKIKETL